MLFSVLVLFFVYFIFFIFVDFAVLEFGWGLFGDGVVMFEVRLFWGTRRRYRGGIRVVMALV